MIHGDLNITVPGASWRDLEVFGSINVMAEGTYIERVRVHGRIWNQHSVGGALRQFDMAIVDSVIGDPSFDLARTADGTVGPGRYKIFRSELYGLDGFRVSKPQGGGRNDVVHNTLDVRAPCGVNAAVFFADSSESAVVTDNLLISDGFTLRIHDDHTPDIGPWIIARNLISSSGFGPALATNTECNSGTMLWAGNALVRDQRQLRHHLDRPRDPLLTAGLADRRCRRHPPGGGAGGGQTALTPGGRRSARAGAGCGTRRRRRSGSCTRR